MRVRMDRHLLCPDRRNSNNHDPDVFANFEISSNSEIHFIISGLNQLNHLKHFCCRHLQISLWALAKFFVLSKSLNVRYLLKL